MAVVYPLVSPADHRHFHDKAALDGDEPSAERFRTRLERARQTGGLVEAPNQRHELSSPRNTSLRNTDDS